MDLNQVTLSGRLTKDLELQESKRGTPFCFFTLACNYNKDRSYFFSCICYNEVAKNIVHKGHKGDRVMLTGYLQRTVDKEGKEVVQVSANVIILVNENEAKESLLNRKEEIRDKREQEKIKKRMDREYPNPMVEVTEEDLKSLPF